MDGVEVLAFLTLIFLLAAAGLVLAIDLGWTSGRWVRIATWAVLTVLVAGTLFVFEFVLVNGIYFTLGAGVAAVALIVSGLLLVATPFAVGLIVSRIAAHRPSH